MDIDKIVGAIDKNLNDHPECDIYSAELHVQAGKQRPNAVFYLGRGPDIKKYAENAFDPGRAKQLEKYDIVRLKEDLSGMANPPNLLNPIRAAFGLGVGPGTLAASFGCYLDPEANYCPSTHITLDELLKKGVPDVENSGLFPMMLEKIELIRKNVPPYVKIGLPDTQGPFNIAHMVLGNDIFLYPIDRKDDFRRGMEIITEFFIKARKILFEKIGKERLTEYKPHLYHIAECSVNLISMEMYMEHVLPHDLRIMNEWGCVGIHTCSGPHVFYATIRNLPKILTTEAGYIGCAIAGWTDVDAAIKEIGGRPIILNIGQELPEGSEVEVVRKDIERLAANPRILLGHTGMRWKKKDEPFILELHKKMNEYYRELIK